MLKARSASEAASDRVQGTAPCHLRTSEFSDRILIVAQVRRSSVWGLIGCHAYRMIKALRH